MYVYIEKESRLNICMNSIIDSTVNNQINSKKSQDICVLQIYWKNIVLLLIICSEYENALENSGYHSVKLNFTQTRENKPKYNRN